MNSTKLTINDIITYINSNIDNFLEKKPEVLESNSDTDESFYLNILNFNEKEKLTKIGNNLDNILLSINSTFYRYGVIKYVNTFDKKNISFYFSILTFLKQHFNSFSQKQQEEYVLSFITQLSLDIKQSKFKEFNYKNLGWTCKSLLDDINSFDIKASVIRYIADYLYVNIFIFHIENEKIYYSGSLPWIKHKKNIFLLCHKDNNFEPINTDKYNIFGINSDLINFVINKSYLIDILYCDDTNKESKTFKEGNENIDVIYDNLDTNYESDEAINNFEENNNESETENNIKYTISEIEENNKKSYINKYKKMYVSQIREELLKLNISIKINNKLKTKKQMCEDLEKYYNMHV